MACKGGKVSEKEKQRMWQLYQELRCFKKVGKKMRRSPATVSRYVHEYETALAMTQYLTNDTPFVATQIKKPYFDQQGFFIFANGE